MTTSESSLADCVARLVLSQYASLCVRDSVAGAWTVIAGMVVEDERAEAGHQLRVVSVASGCKSLAGSPESLNVVRDAHAEVLARRGLRLALQEDLRRLLSGREGLGLLEPSGDDAYMLRRGLRLHLYTSSPPCGDASIYALEEGFHFTGAKLPDWRREADQKLGATRLKPARSDATRRSTSLSCSDKLCRWALAGLEGALLSYWLVADNENPSSRRRGAVSLDSLVVGVEDPRRKEAILAAAQRGIVDRAEATRRLLAVPCTLAVTATTVVPSFATNTPSHIAACWWLGLPLAERDVIVAVTGRPLGVGPRSTRRSRLCPGALFDDSFPRPPAVDATKDYAAWKQDAPGARLATAIADIQLADFPPDFVKRRRRYNIPEDNIS